MSKGLKRVNLMLGEEQVQELQGRGLNVSGLIRDMIDDYLSEHKITLSVSEPTKSLYDKVIANTGSTDEDLEVYLKSSLRQMLRDKIEEMKKLEEAEF